VHVAGHQRRGPDAPSMPPQPVEVTEDHGRDLRNAEVTAAPRGGIENGVDLQKAAPTLGEMAGLPGGVNFCAVP
jgi:hypothetical protein